ncbi:MAG TPA: tripartite tricarboxylate transporter substrate binding protein [Burkholderiales bacterium]|jgi:tripartite-type tricarboxylate transporter receptor subunit TctC|nr:tripartite tricarboxylate transporter substrate binding protein [Burkholderiales bacterium]
MRRSASIVLSVSAVAAGIGAAAAQGYPERPIRIVCPFPPGGSSDFGARILSQNLPPLLKQTVVIDNRGGAGGNIGTDIAAKAAPDGYTLLATSEGPITVSPSLYPRLPYVPARDLIGITQFIKYTHVVVINPTVKVSNIKELIALAKAGKTSYAHPGVGTSNHLAVEQFKIMTHTDMTSVSYKGGGPAIVSVIGNETQVSFATAPSAIPHVKSGKLKAIAITAGKRSTVLPDLPTIAESGVPGYAIEGWVGLLTPAKTPAPVVKRLYDETVKVMKQKEVHDLVVASGSEVAFTTPTETQGLLRDEGAMWAKVIKATGIKGE